MWFVLLCPQKKIGSNLCMDTGLALVRESAPCAGIEGDVDSALTCQVTVPNSHVGTEVQDDTVPPVRANPSVLRREPLSAPHVAPTTDGSGSSVVVSSSTTGALGSAAATSSGSSTLQSASPSSAPTRPSTRLQHGIWKPKTYTDGTVWYGLLTSFDEPMHEALGNDRWKNAMDKEVDALRKNNT
jgi:hypothetical protein